MKVLILLIIASFTTLPTLKAAKWIVSAEGNKTLVAETVHARHEITGFDNIAFPRLRLAAYGGLSFLTDEISNDGGNELNGFYKDLKSGKSLGFDMQYHILKPIGVGIKYSAFQSKASAMVGIDVSEGDLSVKFVGPIVSGRFLHSNDRNSVYFNMGYGYVDYKLVQTAGIDRTVKGNTLASVFDLGYEYGITQKFGIIIQTSYLLGNLKKVERDYAGEKETVDLKKEEYESLHRLDLSLGLRFNI